MTGPALDLGVQSWCFRHFKDNANVAEKVRAIGVDKVELCDFHASFDDPLAFKDMAKVPYPAFRAAWFGL